MNGFSIKALCSIVTLLMLFGSVLDSYGSIDEVDSNKQVRPIVLLFDDYYQKPRTNDFTQGVSLNPDNRHLSNFYSPGANAIPNGTFVLSRLIAEDFTLRVSNKPISKELLHNVGAYMMVCPIKKEDGGRSDITIREAEVLRDFVAQGGILILVLNSIRDPLKNKFDLPGINRIAKQFGLRFEAESTQSLLIPIHRSNPVFRNVRNIIYGGGTIINHFPVPDALPEILLESNNPEVSGPVIVRVRYLKGTVLALSDGGTLGNAHSLRDETDQYKALKQLFHNLLPDGPLPEYRWKNGLKMKVTMHQQQIMSGYPEDMRLFDNIDGTDIKYLEAGVRELDLASSPGDYDSIKLSSYERRFASAIKEASGNFDVHFGNMEKGEFEVEWYDHNGNVLSSKINTFGGVFDIESKSDNFNSWRWVIANESILCPIDPVSRPGDTWEHLVLAPVPHGSMKMTTPLKPAKGSFKFNGIEALNGKQCFVLTKTTLLGSRDINPEDIVASEYMDHFNRNDITFTSSGVLNFTKAWIDSETLLPVRTEMRSTAAYWWKDKRYPDSFISDHDWRTFETRSEILLIATIGNIVTVDFEVISFGN